MRLSELTIPLQAQLEAQVHDVVFQGISIDSRSLQPGNLFIAISGEQFDGHDFIAQAEQQGAAAIIVSKPVSTYLPCLIVNDTRIALGQLAKHWRSRFNIPMAALTGSCGKTTTKAMLAAILQQAGQVLATEGTLNNDIGVPLTLLRLTAEHEYAVIEMGANHLNEIAYLTALVQPHAALITNAGPVHLEGFGDINGVARGKGEIFQGLSEQGIAVLNADDEHYLFWRELIDHRNYISFGFNPTAEVTARSVSNDEQGNQSFILSTPQGDVPIRLAFLGQHNISNALGAAATSLALGAKLTHIQAGLEQVQPVACRLNKHIGLRGAMIIDDTYNANPNAFRVALESIQQYDGEKILVAGDMAELGAWSERYHTELGKLARSMGIQQLFAQGKFSRFTVEAFGAGGQHFNDKQTLADTLIKNLHQQSIVLVKGSRSAKMEEVVNRLLNE